MAAKHLFLARSSATKCRTCNNDELISLIKADAGKAPVISGLVCSLNTAVLGGRRRQQTWTLIRRESAKSRPQVSLNMDNGL